MRPVTFDVIKARRYVFGGTARAKIMARRAFRRLLKLADRRTDGEGFVPPRLTGHDVS